MSALNIFGVLDYIYALYLSLKFEFAIHMHTNLVRSSFSVKTDSATEDCCSDIKFPPAIY